MIPDFRRGPPHACTQVNISAHAHIPYKYTQEEAMGKLLIQLSVFFFFPRDMGKKKKTVKVGF